MIGKWLNQMNPKVLTKIGEDLRKGSYLMGAGIVGITISNDNVTIFEGLALVIFGLYSWILGHCALYWAEKLSNKQGEQR